MKKIILLAIVAVASLAMTSCVTTGDCCASGGACCASGHIHK